MARAWLNRAMRDWRVKTTVPIVAIHIAAFAGLYFFTYQFAMNEVTSAFKIRAAEIVDHAVEIFSDSMKGHGAASVEEGLASVASEHRSSTIAVFSATGEVRSVVGTALPFDPEFVKAALENESDGAVRVRKRGTEILATGVRVLRNEPSCRECHSNDQPVLGGIGIQRSLGDRVQGTTDRLRRAVGLAFLGWVALLGVSLVIRNKVIGQPLARIEESVLGSAGTAAPGEPSHDLERLAGTVHGAIWRRLERQQERDREVEKGMERATQLAVLGDVAAGLSHEIKNPLAGLRAGLSGLRRGDAIPQAERTEIIDAMVSEVDRVNRTVDALLSLARPRSLVKTPADLGRLVTKATALLDARARSRAVRLSVYAVPDLPSLDLDSDLVMQVVVNLVTNAFDAVKDGGSVRVGVEPFPGRDGVMLVVSDDGEGISEKARARVFEPFFTTKHGGTGLGLPLCLRIVEQHGGTITVESEPGKGTTVLVLFPCRVEPVRKRSEHRGVHPAR